MRVSYVGRPGISPALATLIAQQKVRKHHRILDAGCGTGTDALLLGHWGFRSVDAIDPNAENIRIAKGRASRKRLGKRVRFHRMGAEDLGGNFERRSFDVILHTLVANNLTKGFDRHFRGLARVCKLDGLLVHCIRTRVTEENAAPGRVKPIPRLTRYFDVSPSVSSHLAERDMGQVPPYARVTLWLGRPRRTSGP